MKVFKNILLAFFAFLFAIVTGAFTYYFVVTSSVKLDCKKLNLVQNGISIYDKDGELLRECSAAGENGVKAENLPLYTIDAFICAEDKNFFSHHGLDYKRMAAALWRNVKSFSFKEGASTISQQLVKNTQLSPKKTINRKLKEIKLTKMLEKQYSKDEIMEMYLNTIYFGHSCFGLESAARFYFDCSPEELTLSESAILAGMTKSPNNYSPLKKPENCKNRRNFVLNVMKQNGYISETEALQAKDEPLPEEGHEKSGFAESYFSAVIAESEELLGENVYGGIKIYTYLDRNLQAALEETAEGISTDFSFCVTDNDSHGIKAFYSTIGSSKRLPGSIIKPLLVYAPAFEENVLSPATPIADEPIDYAGYAPKNYDGKYHGYVSAREALANSYNIPAVKVLNTLGIKKAVAYLKKAGLNTDERDYNLTLALGGMREGFSLKDLCAAYSVFANEGYFTPSSFIKEIISSRGNALCEKNKSAQKVFDNETVTLLNDVLKTTTKTGTAKKLKTDLYEVCAKTGTCGTQNGNTDAYCIAYTSKEVIGAWLGNADYSPMKNITGGGKPTDIVGDIMQYLYKNETPADFKKSADVIECTLDKREYEENHALVLCDENAPIQEKTLREYFKKSCIPKKQSSYFSHPNLQSIDISSQNDGILIKLCQREYLTIVINREENGHFKTVYQGDSVNKFLDKDVMEGKTYIYSVTPFYKKFVGKTVILPQIRYMKKGSGDKNDKADLLSRTEQQRRSVQA